MKFGFGDAILLVVIVTFVAKLEFVDSKTISSKSKSLMEEDLEDDDDDQRNILENQNWLGLYFIESNYDYLPLAVIFTVCKIIKWIILSNLKVTVVLLSPTDYNKIKKLFGWFIVKNGKEVFKMFSKNIMELGSSNHVLQATKNQGNTFIVRKSPIGTNWEGRISWSFWKSWNDEASSPTTARMATSTTLTLRRTWSTKTSRKFFSGLGTSAKCCRWLDSNVSTSTTTTTTTTTMPEESAGIPFLSFGWRKTDKK